MTSIEVDYWIEKMENDHFSTQPLDEESQKALLRLFEVTDCFEPVGDDERKEFWICAERCSFEEFREYYYDPETEESEVREVFEYEYPDAVSWYHFTSFHHHVREVPYYGVFLNGNYVLSVGDATQNGWPVNAVPFISWLTEKTEEAVEKCRDGRYEAEISLELPDKYKYGKISRKDYWDIYPKLRQEYREGFSEEEIDRFLEIVEQDRSKKEGETGMEQITARDYYEACAVCYRAVDLRPRQCFNYTESGEERKRYGNPTPKELYYTYADGRDDGMINVPMDDPEAFAEWRNKKGPYYEFNGCHPWEIITSMSQAFSIHLSVSRNSSGNGYSFMLSGDQLHTSVSTIKMFLALKDAGLPVILWDADVIAARLTETDRIGILPMAETSFYGKTIGGECLRDTVNLADGDRPDLVAQKTMWIPQKELKLRNSAKVNYPAL